MLFEMIKVENLVIENGGRDRIRTYGGLPHTYFPSKHLKPLRHSSEKELYKTNIQKSAFSTTNQITSLIDLLERIE